MELIINIVLGFLSAYIIYEYYRTFFDVRKESAIPKLVLSTFVLWQLVSMPVFFDIHSTVRAVINIMFIFIIGICFFGSVVGKIVFAFIYSGIWTLTELLLGSIFLMLQIDIGKYSTLGSVFCELYLLILVKLLQLFFRHENIRNFSWKNNSIFMVIPIAYMFFSYELFVLSAKSGEISDIILSGVAFVLLMISMFLIFMMYIKLVDRYELKRNNAIFEKEIALHSEYIKEKEGVMNEFRKTKHDLKHKLMNILDLLRNKKYDQLEKYIEDIADLKMLENITVSNTDNTLVDALINYKYDTAKKLGIKLNVSMQIPYNLPFNNADLCVILGNALDNAIEASEKVPKEKAYINLMMRYAEENLVIVIENYYEGKNVRNKEGKIITSKKDHYNHGVGLSSIQNSISKYNGQLNIEETNSVFKLAIIMYG